MSNPYTTEFYYQSWTERIEHGLQTSTHSVTRATTDAIMSISKLAHDFEFTYQLIKQPVSRSEEIRFLNRFFGGNVLTLVNPTFYINYISTEDDELRELAYAAEKVTPVRYLDIHPMTTLSGKDGGLYRGPHLILDVFIPEEVSDGTTILNVGMHLAAIPFNKVVVSPNNIPHQLN